MESGKTGNWRLRMGRGEMVQFSLGIFLMMHAVVHLLYAGQAGRLFELRPGLKWPQGSWLLGRMLEVRALNTVTAASMLLAGLAFLTAGVGTIAFQEWGRAAVSGAAVFSALMFILLWDGRMKELDAQGAVGVAIDMSLLAAVWVLG